MKENLKRCVECSIKEQEQRLYTENHLEAFNRLLGMRTILTFSNNGKEHVKMINEIFDKYFEKNKKELNGAVESNV